MTVGPHPVLFAAILISTGGGVYYKVCRQYALRRRCLLARRPVFFRKLE